MNIINRIKHTQSMGEEWMSTGEVDLMIATMLFDRRYEDLCFVLHCAYSLYLEHAVDLYVRYKKAFEYHQVAQAKKVSWARSDAKILKLYDASVNQLLFNYKALMNIVI